MPHGQVHGDDAVAATERDVGTLVVSRSVVGLPVPNVTAIAFVMADFIGDAVSNGEVQVEDTVAAVGGHQIELTIIGARFSILKAEAISVIHAWLALPTTAVVDGDVVLLVGIDIHEYRILAFAMDGVGLCAGQNGVVADLNIGKAMTRIKLTCTYFIVLDDVLLGGIDDEIGSVAR